MSLRNDFYEDEQREEKEVRRDALRDSVDRRLWRFLGKNEVRVKVFRMSMAYSFFLELLEEEPEGERCLLHIEKLRRGYEVSQVLLDERNEPMRKTTKAYFGRVLRAETLDEAVVKFMDGCESQILNKPVFE